MGTCISKGLLHKQHSSSSFTETDPPQDKLIISQSPASPKIQTWSSSTPPTSSSSFSTSTLTFNSTHTSSNLKPKTPQITVLDPHKPNGAAKLLRPPKPPPKALPMHKTCKQIPLLKSHNKQLPSKRPPSAQPASLPRHNSTKKESREAPHVSITADRCKKPRVHSHKKPSHLPLNAGNQVNSTKKESREAPPVSITADRCKQPWVDSHKKPSPLALNAGKQVNSTKKESREAPPVSITADRCKQLRVDGQKKPSPLALKAGEQVRRNSVTRCADARKEKLRTGNSRNSVKEVRVCSVRQGQGCSSGEVISLCTAGIPPSEDFDNPLISMDCFIFV